MMDRMLRRQRARGNRGSDKSSPGSRTSLRFLPDPASRNFVGLVDIIFGVLIAQGFISSKDKIIALEVSLGTGSLFLVYLGILLSWIGYHESVRVFPYNATPWSRVRLGMDIFILLLYAYLLFVAFELSKVLVGWIAVFSFYAVTGVVRRIEWRDRRVAKPELSVIVAAVFGILSYLSMVAPIWDVLWLLLSLVALVAYRIMRRKLGYGLIFVGVDVDGVLAEQIDPVLDRLRKLGKAKGLTREDIVDWYFLIDNTDIATEIESALRDPDFVSEMPVQPGSTKAMESLFRDFHTVVATARPVETSAETYLWLRKNFKFHEYANTRQVGKENLGLQVLIDDNLENAKAFARSGGTALLFSQPWNRKEDPELRPLMATRKLQVCDGWTDVLRHIRSLGGLSPVDRIPQPSH